MKPVSKKEIEIKFNKQIYQTDSPIIISSDTYWDGGIDSSLSLKEKSDFYNLAENMSSILKQFVLSLKEEIYVADFLCENNKMYAEWSNLKRIELFQIISKAFKKGKCYNLT